VLYFAFCLSLLLEVVLMKKAVMSDIAATNTIAGK
jgi:hypothetical protein